jgi:hypothetical protein
MSIEEQGSGKRSTIAIVAVLLLFAATLAYSQGWFDWPRSSDGVESNNVRTDQRIDEEQSNADGVQLTKETAQPADTVTK